MYESFFGLRERPFDLTPNPRFLYLTGRHREALSNLQYGILGRKGITLLVGEAGTGKTTVVRAAIESMAGRDVRCAHLTNPALTRDEFYELLANRLGLGPDAAASKARFLRELEASVAARRKAGGIVALVIDEAQSLPAPLMEEVRLLANLETDTEKLLPVVLAGQPELSARLDMEDMRQLKQRVALRCELSPLDLRETAAYISGRIHIAGGDGPRMFTREAVLAIHEASRGIPRTISVVCDNALVTAFAAGVKPVGAAIVADVCRDFRLAPIRTGEAGRTPSGPIGIPGDSGPRPQAVADARPAGPSAPAGAALPPAAGLAAPAAAALPPAAGLSARVGTVMPDGSRSTSVATLMPPDGGNGNGQGRLASQVATQAVEVEAPPAPVADAPMFSSFTRKRRFRFF